MLSKQHLTFILALLSLTLAITIVIITEVKDSVRPTKRENEGAPLAVGRFCLQAIMMDSLQTNRGIVRPSNSTLYFQRESNTYLDELIAGRRGNGN